MNLKQYTNKFKGYGELREQSNRSFSVAMLNGHMVTNLLEENRGVSARCFSKGYWGFAASSVMDSSTVEGLLKKAWEGAEVLASAKPREARLVPGGALKSEKNFQDKTSLGQAHWVDFLKALDERLQKKYPDLLGRRLVFRGLTMEKHLYTTEGVEFHSVVPRGHLIIGMTKEASFGPVEYYDKRGGLGTLENYFCEEPSSMDDWLNEIYYKASLRVGAVLPKAGRHTVVLASNLAGILAHEAIGHTAEADVVRGGSVARDYLNQEVASPKITLVDFAHSYQGELCPQPIFVDDEGTVAEDTVVIEKGVLKSYMNNKESSAHFSQRATGHARAFKYMDEPLIRMRNTAILPGDSRPEELISAVEDGYYLSDPGGGQADSTSEFMFAVGFGYEIKNGKLARPLRDTTISGVAFEMLKSVKMVGNDFSWESAGYCGKKQLMPVGMGGPSLLCEVQVGGQ